jgi:hypothetical protein
MNDEQPRMKCSCRCGRVAATVTGKPIAHAICYCNDCRTAGLAFAQAKDAPPVVDGDGGTDLLLVRKDRVGRFSGGEVLREHRLTPDTKTRRVVATCCNTPMFLDVTNGHWLSLYTGRLSGPVPPLDFRVMTAQQEPKTPLADDVPNYATHSPRFLFKLLAAWIAMGFRRPKVAW